MYSFHDLEPVCCSMSSSNCCFLTCIQISQEGGQVVWYSHLFKNFPQFVVILLVAKFRLKLKKVWKTTRPFRYDLNKIPYNYTLDVTNRFKELDQIDRVPEGSWHCIGGSDQDHSQEKEMQKGKMVVWGSLTNNWEKKWNAKEERKDISIWMQRSK